MTHSSGYQQQRGAVLFVALVFLILMTLLALVATNTSMLQERMTGGMRNAQLAQIGSDNAVRAREYSLWNRGLAKLNCGLYGGSNTAEPCYARGTNTATGVGQAKYLVSSNVTNFLASGMNWAVTPGSSATPYSYETLSGGSATAKLAARPRFITELLGAVMPPGAVASGQGGRRLSAIDRSATSQTLYAYRITGRSTGGSDVTVRQSESVFMAQPPSN